MDALQTQEGDNTKVESKTIGSPTGESSTSISLAEFDLNKKLLGHGSFSEGT